MSERWEEELEEEQIAKRARYSRCLSGVEFKMEVGALRDIDPEKLKNEIRRWAKAVVAYARQLSGRFSSTSTRSEAEDP